MSDFERVYKQYYIRLYRYAYGFVCDIDASKDIVSDVFSCLWKRWEHIDASHVQSYLYACVRNASINYLRERKGMERYISYCQAAFTEEDEDYWRSMEDRLDEINKVVESMPSKTRFVLEQCYLEEKTYKEVGQMLDITPDGVKKHIVKAFSLLRQHFNVKKH